MSAPEPAAVTGTLQDVPEKINFPKAEEQTLAYWTKIDAFKECLKQSEGKPEYVFFDGPPFATGNPHYGHILAGTIKDVRTRYAHQTGHHVPRRFGWDCHGLPIEFEIEKMLGIKTKTEVLALGIDKYNEHCRSIVMRCSEKWKEVVPRMGRWIDFDNDYKTMDMSFMESVWWVFKQLFDKGLIYRGFQVMPYSMACSTPISNFEKDLNYQDVSDPAVVVTFPLIDDPETSFVAWTTTPWTLPSNIALCVNPAMEYVKIKAKVDGKQLWMLEARTVELYKTAEEFDVLEKCLGAALKGKRYTPLFDYYSKTGDYPNGWQVLCDSYVTAESGTGIVHQAPAFGEDDFRVCLAAKIIQKGQALPCPVDCMGNFEEPVTEWLGLNVKAADKGIMKVLKEKGRLASQSQYFHSYPHCWRSDTPLIYKAVPSWFCRVEDMREKLVKNNASTHWVPDNVKTGRFNNWLANARDWNLGRTRYWGTPLPIWTNDDYSEMVVIGSVEELFEKSGVRVTDLHRHHVDQITIPAPSGNGVLHRVEEVFDCWFESGSMPYGQCHYPFENKEKFEASFPADFIAEGLDQTRGWFYTLMVLSTALFDRPAFKNNVVNGIVKAMDGKKMSKRLKNYPDPMDIADVHGADALRLYLVNSPVVRGQDLKFNAEGVKHVVRDVLLPWFNAYRFFVLQAQRVGVETDKAFAPNHDIVSTATNVMDRWFIAKLQTLIGTIHQEIGIEYKLYTVVPELLNYLDQMTNWYVRLNRDRLKGQEGAQQWHDSLSTMYYALFTLCKAMAPLTPFMVEYQYQNLKTLSPDDAVDSVHYLMLPVPNEAASDPDIERAVARMQEVIEGGRTIRDQVKLPLRQPLSEVTVVSSDTQLLEDLKSLSAYITTELNIKKLHLCVDDGTFVTQSLMVNFKTMGRKLGRDMPKVKKAVEALSAADVEAFIKTGTIDVEGHTLKEGDLVAKTEFKGAGKGSVAGRMSGDGSCLVLLNTEISEELELEGISRDIINRAQKMRKDGNLNMKDKLELFFSNTSGKKGKKVLTSLAKYGAVIGEKLGMPPPVDMSSMPAFAVPLARDDAVSVAGAKLVFVLTRLSVNFNVEAVKEAVTKAGVAAAEVESFSVDVQTLVAGMDYNALDSSKDLSLNVDGKDIQLVFGKHVFLSTHESL